jgi:hypothetical protein
MNYTKPELVELGSAITSVEASRKPNPFYLDAIPHQTVPAYEADE